VKFDWQFFSAILIGFIAVYFGGLLFLWLVTK